MNQHRDEDQLCAGEKVAFSGFIFTTAYVVFITAKITLIFIHTIHKLAWKPTYTWFQNKTMLFVFLRRHQLYCLSWEMRHTFFLFQVRYFLFKEYSLTRGSTICKTYRSVQSIFFNFWRWIPTTFDNNLPDRLKLFKGRLLSLCYSQSSLSRSISVAFVT